MSAVSSVCIESCDVVIAFLDVTAHGSDAIVLYQRTIIVFFYVSLQVKFSLSMAVDFKPEIYSSELRTIHYPCPARYLL